MFTHHQSTLLGLNWRQFDRNCLDIMPKKVLKNYLSENTDTSPIGQWVHWWITILIYRISLSITLIIWCANFQWIRLAPIESVWSIEQNLVPPPKTISPTSLPLARTARIMPRKTVKRSKWKFISLNHETLCTLRELNGNFIYLFFSTVVKIEIISLGYDKFGGLWRQDLEGAYPWVSPKESLTHCGLATP